MWKNEGHTRGLRILRVLGWFSIHQADQMDGPFRGLADGVEQGGKPHPFS